MSDPAKLAGASDSVDEQALAGLLRKAGARPEPPAAVREQVRAQVRAEWQATVRAQAARRRRTGWWSAAAGAGAVAVLAGWLASQSFVAGPTVPVANLQRANGAVEIRDGEVWRQIAEGEALPAGTVLRTGPGARAALALDAETGLRLDGASRVTLAAADRLILEAGAAYLDSRPDAGSETLVIETPFGATRHLGTQYEVRLTETQARVRVREGRVQLSRDGEQVEAVAGEQLTTGGDVSGVRREAIDTWGPEWAWTGEVAPGVAIDGRSLDEFLVWAARETGRQLRYASPAVAREAAAVILGGDVAGLSPDLALQAVMATTTLDQRTQSDQLIVDFKIGPAR